MALALSSSSCLKISPKKDLFASTSVNTSKPFLEKRSDLSVQSGFKIESGWSISRRRMHACFACRVYSKNDGPFSTTGFRNWKSALEAGTKPKGFAKHALSTSHVEAMKLWAEHKNRENTKSSVDTLVLKNYLNIEFGYKLFFIQFDILLLMVYPFVEIMKIAFSTLTVLAVGFTLILLRIYFFNCNQN